MSEQFSGRVIIVDGQGREVFQFDSQFSVLDLGRTGQKGIYVSAEPTANSRFSVDGSGQLVNITNEAGATVFLFDASHSVLDLEPGLGARGRRSGPVLFGAVGQLKSHLESNTADIRLIGADCSEDFDIDESRAVQLGSVLTLGEGGRLRPCTEAYDRGVAGVVSGAGSFRSGIVLDSRHGRPRRAAVTLTGKLLQSRPRLLPRRLRRPPNDVRNHRTRYEGGGHDGGHSAQPSERPCIRSRRHGPVPILVALQGCCDGYD